MVKKAAHATPNRRLRAARKEHGWTQQQVADHIGAPFALNISRWESGTAFPSAYYIERLCQLFGKSVRELGLSQLEGKTLDEQAPLQAALLEHLPSSPAEQQKSRTNASRASTSTSQTPGAERANRLLVPDDRLPVPLTSFIGREEEVTAISVLLRQESVRLLTLTGTAGVGKTRLALEVARNLLHDFADGVHFVSLAPISDPALVIPTIAHSLELVEGGSQSALDLLKISQRDKQRLFLLDNFEQVIPAATQLAELLETCPGLKLLVTSREVLRLRAEHQFAVPPLALPELKHLPDDQSLAHIPAVKLFLQRAQAIRADFHLTTSNAAVIAEICLRLDGLPLALELAAARVKVLSPQELLVGLEHRLHLLTRGARDLPERHQTLRKTIQWSYDLLSRPEQQVFRRLSVFVGGCTFEALKALSVAVGDGTDLILDMVTALVDKSLVQRVEPSEEEPRFTMLETIREYGLECLLESGEWAQTRQAHAQVYLAFAEEAKPYLRDAQQTLWLARLERERGNLRAAMHWSLEQAESGRSLEIALRLGDALEQFWMTRGPYSEGRLFLERAVEASGDVAPAVRTNALIAAANLVSIHGDYAKGKTLAQESLRVCQQLGDKSGIARSLFQLGRAAYIQGNLREARAYMEKNVAVRREIGEKLWIATALRNLAYVLSDQGEYTRAEVLCEESVQMLREEGYREALAHSLFPWAWTMFLSQGDLAVVQSIIEEGLALARELESKESIAEFLLLSGWVALKQGDAPGARQLLEESLAIYREVGARQGIGLSLSLLGKAVADQGDYRAARALYEECLELNRAMGNMLNMPSCLEGLADTLAAQGELVLAARLWGTASAQRDALGMPIPPVERAHYEASVAAVRIQLGEEMFTAEWSQGRIMTPEQVYC